MEIKSTADVPLTEATSNLMSKIERANKKARNIGLVTLVLVTILVGLGVAGIYKQNQLAVETNKLAVENTQHINCIIKDLSTPLPAGSRAKYIENLQKDCNIKFTN